MKKLLLTLFVASTLLTVGCAKEKLAVTNNTPAPVDPIIDPIDPTEPVIPGGIDTGNPYGASAPLILDGDTSSAQIATLNNYLGNTSPSNNPTGFTVHVDFVETSDGTYSGNVSINFMDRGRLHQDIFRTGSGGNKTRFNKWLFNDTAFHAILDDGKFGALVFVIDQVVNLGDGAGNESLVSGTIFYMNYPIVLGHGGRPANVHPQQNGVDGYCWDISRGLYQCLPWSSSNPADTTLYPPKMYSVLGKFSNLNVTKAFNY